MNRRDFPTTAAMTPTLARTFGPLRAQTAGGRLLCVSTYTNTAADQAKGTPTFKDRFPVGGTPRNFKIEPTGNYVLVIGQNNGVTLVFKIDRSTGMLTKTNVTLDPPAPVCIAFV